MLRLINLSNREMVLRKKNVNKGMSTDLTLNSQGEHFKRCMGNSAENLSLDHYTERVKGTCHQLGSSCSTICSTSPILNDKPASLQGIILSFSGS